MVHKGKWMSTKGIDWDIYDFGGVRYVQRCDDIHTMSDQQAISAAREAGYNIAEDGRVLDTAARGDPFDLYSADLQIARDLVDGCYDTSGDGTYLDLSRFLDRLSDAIECRHFETKKLGRFTVNASEIARYLWCCLSLTEACDPGGRIFRGVSVLE